MHTPPTSPHWFKKSYRWALLFILLLAISGSAALWFRASAQTAAEVTATTAEVAPAGMMDAEMTVLAAAPAGVMEVVSSLPAAESAGAAEMSATAAVLPSSENCIACHTNLEVLQTLAEEPEAVHSTEASGEG